MKNIRAFLAVMVMSLLLTQLHGVTYAATTATAATSGNTFTDDFTSSNAGKWSVVKGASWKRTGGKCYSPAEIAIMAYKGKYYSDFVFEADVSVGNNYDGGVFFRSKNPDKEDGYYFGLYAQTDEVRLYKLASATKPLAAYAKLKIDPNTVNHVKIVAKGSNIKIYVNSMEKPIIDINDSTYSTGYLGLRSYYTKASYDNVSVVEPKYLKNVFVLNFDPVIEAEGGKRLHEVVGGADPKVLKNAFVNDLMKVSGNNAYYNVVEWIDLDEFPLMSDDFRYNDKSYIDVINGAKVAQGCGFNFDYDYYISKYGLVKAVKSGKIDEVYIFADGTDMGLYESKMIGESAYWCNSPETKIKGSKNFVCMFFNYDRGDDCMLESYGHRAESILNHVFNKSHSNRVFPKPEKLNYNDLNMWEKFSMYGSVAGNFKNAVLGVGSVHYAPNSKVDYDWNNSSAVKSNYKYFLSYPNSKRKITDVDTIDCSLWNKSYPVPHNQLITLNNASQWSHHMWWFDCMPKAEGSTNGYLNDWWAYITLSK